MFKNIILSSLIFISFGIEVSADDHQPIFPGLVSSDVFAMGNDMDMHIEEEKHVIQGAVAKSIFIRSLQVH